MWQKPRARTLNLEGRSVARVPPYVARNVCCVDVQTLSVVSGSMFAGRGSMVAVRGSRFVGGGSQVAVCDPNAQAPLYRRAERLLRRRLGGVSHLPCRCLSGSWFAIPSLRRHQISARNVRCGTSPVSSATYLRLTSFPTFSPMSIDAGCGGSRVGPHSCSTTGGTPGAYKGTWSPIHWSVCGADARLSTWGIPVS